MSCLSRAQTQEAPLPGDKIDRISTITRWNTPSRTKQDVSHGRNMAGCHQEFSSNAHGTKGYALISGPGGHRSQARLQRPRWDSDLAWMFGQRGGGRPLTESSPYQDEWEHLMDAIRNDRPYNEVGAAFSKRSNFNGPNGCSHRSRGHL